MSYSIICSSSVDIIVIELFSKTIAPLCTQNICLDNKDPKWLINMELKFYSLLFYDLMFNCYRLYPIYTFIYQIKKEFTELT